jgi:osmotically inducible lipoprotein OsmB
MTGSVISQRRRAQAKAGRGPSLLGPVLASLVLAGAAIGLGGCGNDPGTRAVTGGLIGAGARAGIAAVTGGRPATGALIGGGVGAVGGAVTAPR